VLRGHRLCPAPPFPDRAAAAPGAITGTTTRDRRGDRNRMGDMPNRRGKVRGGRAEIG
jgi:hypothetical protein